MNLFRKTKTSRLKRVLLTIGFALVLFIPVDSLEVATASESCITNTPTGYSICGSFLDYWYTNGGLGYFGWSISNVTSERNALPPAGDGQIHTVQYFERARMELHPENKPPYTILLGLLGTEQYSIRPHNGQSAPAPEYNDDCFFIQGFPQGTCGLFGRYYKANGGLLKFGGPISHIFYERNAPPAGDGQVHIVQYFERVRMEYHPENSAPNNLLFGLLGSEQLALRNGTKLPTPAPVTAPPSQPTPTPTVPPTQPPAPSTEKVGGSVWIRNDNPTQYSVVTVYAQLFINDKPTIGAQTYTFWHYKTVDQFCSGIADNNGLASCSRNISDATIGYTVYIDVETHYNGKIYSARTGFTPVGSNGGGNPPPTPAPAKTTVTFISVQRVVNQGRTAV